MTVLKILQRCRTAETEIADHQWSIDALRESAERVTGLSDALPGWQGGGDRLSGTLAAIDGIEREIERRRKQWAWEMETATLLMCRAGHGVMESVMMEYYVHGLGLPAVAKALFLSETYARKMKRVGDRTYSNEKYTEVPDWYKQSLHDSSEYSFTPVENL